MAISGGRAFPLIVGWFLPQRSKYAHGVFPFAGIAVFARLVGVRAETFMHAREEMALGVRLPRAMRMQFLLELPSIHRRSRFARFQGRASTTKGPLEDRAETDQVAHD
jgi:hypothetical protein